MRVPAAFEFEVRDFFTDFGRLQTPKALQNYRGNDRIGCILHLFGSAVGEYFVASLRIRVATLIDFRLLSIRVATLIDFDPFFDQGRYPNQF